MRFYSLLFAFLVFSGYIGCKKGSYQVTNAELYVAFSRTTDPRDLASVLADLPSDVDSICTVAKHQTIHHNLLGYYDIPRETSTQMRGLWPPSMPAMLARLQQTGPGALSLDRKPEERVISACILESHFLAGLLRSKGYPARIRTGYFRNMNSDRGYFVDFWKDALRARGVMNELDESDSTEWNRIIEEFTSRQFDADHNIEHWVCEYWDRARREWQILDANNTFLRAHSRIDEGYRLSRDHFQFAFEAWQIMRTAEDFNPDQYSEEPQDGRSHIRSQLLWDFYSLLNHDISGYNTSGEISDSTHPEKVAFAFIKQRSFQELSSEELEELDALATFIAGYPSVEQLVEFYRTSRTLRLQNVEQDPYSFVHSGGDDSGKM